MLVRRAELCLKATPKRVRTAERKRESHITQNTKPERRPHTPSHGMFLLKKGPRGCPSCSQGQQDPDTDTPVDPAQGRDAEMLHQSPQGRSGKAAALHHSTLRYFKHYDFIVVCSEAAQMGCFNSCYYRKIRRPRLEAGFLSSPVRAS